MGERQFPCGDGGGSPWPLLALRDKVQVQQVRLYLGVKKCEKKVICVTEHREIMRMRHRWVGRVASLKLFVRLFLRLSTFRS